MSQSGNGKSKNVKKLVRSKSQGAMPRPKGKKRKQKIQAENTTAVQAQKFKKRVSKAQLRSGDARTSAPTVPQLYAGGLAESISYVVNLNSFSCYGLAYAYVSAAVQRGWLTNTPQPSYPFAAWQYITKVFQSFINGTIPQGAQMPYWMWAIGRAISAKSVPGTNGLVYYKGLISENNPPSSALFACGPVAYGYDSNLYVPDTTSTDMFPNAKAPTTPTESEQSQAFQSLCGYMADPKIFASTMCDSTVKTVFDQDVSAFSVIADTTGFGDMGNGGIGYNVGLEVYVKTPALATVLTQSDLNLTGSNVRFSKFPTTFAGDDMFVGAMFPLMSIKHWKTRIYPKFKFIDFLQIQEVVALWATQLLDQYFLDPAMYVTPSTNNGDQHTANSVCPLTLQEMGLILRNEIMFMFGQTQSAVMNTLPILPTGGSDNQFMPYLTGTTGCAVQTFGMKLPQILIENLRALTLHIIRGKHTTKKGKVKYNNDVELLVPVIGQYQTDILSSGDYQFAAYGVNDSVGLTNTFSAEPSVMRAVRKRTKDVETVTWEKMVETPINFIDTSNGTVYVFINDPGRLKQLTELWNKWVSTYAAYSSNLGVVSADPGAKVLTSIDQTRYWQTITPEAKKRAADFKDTRISKASGLETSVYTNRHIFAISYRDKPFQCAASITANWILPVAQLQVGAASPNASTFTKVSALYGEDMSQTISTTGDAGMTMSALNADYAAMMVHAKGTTSTLDADLLALSAKGQAGILSSLGNMLGSLVGGQAGDIIKGVGNAADVAVDVGMSLF